MINKINKGRWRSMNTTPHDPATRTSGKESRKTPPKRKREKKTGQDTRQSTDSLIAKMTHKKKQSLTDKELKNTQK
jgi:hypothetical protein